MKIAICEDEQYWNDLLKASISSWAEGKITELQCVSFNTPKELIKHLIENIDIDVVFLDISLGNEVINGMATAKYIRKIENCVPIIFFTADSAYAVDGYLVEAMGFLCKPIDEKRLALFLDRILKQKKSERIINIISESEVINVPQSDIIYAEVIDHTIYYHTKKRVIKIRGTLHEIIDLLDRENFVQIHRSYVISKAKINRIKTTYPYSVNLLGGIETINLPVSRSYIYKLLEVYSDDVLEMMI